MTNSWLQITKLQNNKYDIIFYMHNCIRIIVDNKYYLYKFLYYLSILDISKYMNKIHQEVICSVNLGNFIFNIFIYNMNISGIFYSFIYFTKENQEYFAIPSNEYNVFRKFIKEYLNSKEFNEL